MASLPYPLCHKVLAHLVGMARMPYPPTICKDNFAQLLNIILPIGAAGTAAPPNIATISRSNGEAIALKWQCESPYITTNGGRHPCERRSASVRTADGVRTNGGRHPCGRRSPFVVFPWQEPYKSPAITLQNHLLLIAVTLSAPITSSAAATNIMWLCTEPTSERTAPPHKAAMICGTQIVPLNRPRYAPLCP